MKKNKLILAFFLLVVAQQLLAQNADILDELKKPTANGGVILMEEDSLLSGLIDLQRIVNLQNGGVDGFRIQLYRGSEVSFAREEAMKVKAMVLEKFPDATVNEEYDRPVWYVRMGHFVKYNEALKLRAELESKLPELRDNINIIPAKIKVN